MTNRKRSSFALALFACALCFLSIASHTFASGGISFTEIMYDPAGTDTNREWIEVYNAGSSPVDISNYVLQTDGASSSHHVLAPQSGSSVPAGGYAVIVQNPDSFKADYPNFAGLIFDSSWTGLTATSGKTLLILDGLGAVLDQVTYDPNVGGNNDGNSLQKNASGAWVAAVPTPGAGSSGGAASTATVTTSDGGSSTGGGLAAPDTSSVASNAKPVAPPRMQAALIVQKEAVTGITISISTRVIGLAGEYRGFGTFHYALGDGTAYDSKTPEAFEHTYEFPGTYVVSFEYRSNPYLHDPDITARATIAVIDSSVVISGVSSAGAVSLMNNGDDEIDMSKWSIVSFSDDNVRFAFTIVPGTILLPGKTIILPQKTTNLVFATPPNVEIVLPSGAISAMFGTVSSPVIASTQTEIAPVTSGESASANEYPHSQAMLAGASYGASQENPDIGLAGNAIGAAGDESPAAPKKTTRSLIPYIIALLGIIIGSVIAVRKFSVVSSQETSEEESDLASETQEIADRIRIVE